MSKLKELGIKIKVDEYLKYSCFENLYERFMQKMVFENNYTASDIDKYLLASMLACVEGNVYVDLEKKIWVYWDLESNEIVNKSYADSYLLSSICNYLKSNKRVFNLIIAYFDLWHSGMDSDFKYDRFHKEELEENTEMLIYLIKDDIKTALNKHDAYTVTMLFMLLMLVTENIEIYDKVSY